MNIKWMSKKELEGQSEWQAFCFRNFFHDNCYKIIDIKKRVLSYKGDINSCNYIQLIIDFIRQDEREKINEEALIKCKQKLKSGRERFKKESTKKEKGVKKRVVRGKKKNG